MSGAVRMGERAERIRVVDAAMARLRQRLRPGRLRRKVLECERWLSLVIPVSPVWCKMHARALCRASLTWEVR